MLALERRELAVTPQAEVAQLASIYEAKGLTPGLARHVAERLTEHGAFAAHAEAELGIDPGQLARPGHAAVASFLSFTVGAVLAALVVAGAASAALGRSPRLPAVVRNVLGGAVAMGVTYGIGSLIGASGI